MGDNRIGMGQTVLDPMCGSGTALVAALKLRREAIGLDQSPEAVALARRRAGQGLQPDLFGAVA